MIVTRQKELKDILETLRPYQRIFLVGCGECATTCKTGGKEEIKRMKDDLEKAGKKVVGLCLPGAPCIAAQLKAEFARQISYLKEAEAVLVLACGLGIQSVRENNRFKTPVFSGCDTLFAAVLDAQGKLRQVCSLCGDCLLSQTGGFCPVTLCPKGMLNGPCGGAKGGRCEVDKTLDCVWVLIYEQLNKEKRLEALHLMRAARDFSKIKKPLVVVAGENKNGL